MCVLSYRKTKVGNVDIIQIRPPRYIGRDGIIVPYYPNKAIGKALLQVGILRNYIPQWFNDIIT